MGMEGFQLKEPQKMPGAHKIGTVNSSPRIPKVCKLWSHLWGGTPFGRYRQGQPDPDQSKKFMFMCLCLSIPIEAQGAPPRRHRDRGNGSAPLFALNEVGPGKRGWVASCADRRTLGLLPLKGVFAEKGARFRGKWGSAPSAPPSPPPKIPRTHAPPPSLSWKNPPPPWDFQ